MSNKWSNLREEDLVTAEAGEPTLPCPSCGITDRDKLGLSLMDQVLRSHTELRTALRLAGRLVLRFERQDHQSLEHIRRALKRAENIGKSLSVRDDAEEQNRLEKLFAAAHAPPSVPADGSSDNGLATEIVRKRPRLTRPHSLRIIKGPTS